MRHCCRIKADDIYYLKDNELSSSRYLSIGFCPMCRIPVAELCEWKFDGTFHRCSKSGIEANALVDSLKNDIVYSVRELNYKRANGKPFGWRYGINKAVKSGGNEIVKQYACDFYGNKELVKIYK